MEVVSFWSKIFTEICSEIPIYNKEMLARIMARCLIQAIIWTNDGLCCWYILVCVSLWLDDFILISVYYQWQFIFKKSHFQRLTAIITMSVNTLRQIGRHFATTISNALFDGNIWVSIGISLKFVFDGPINNIPALVQTIAWRRPGDKPLSDGQITDAYINCHSTSMS